MNINYKNAVNQKRRQNKAELPAALGQAWLEEKIARFARIHNMDINTLRGRIRRRDSLALALFAKEPRRQNIHRDVFISFLDKQERNGTLVDVEILPATGANALFLTENGQLVPRILTENSNINNRSLDFKLTIPCRGGDITTYIIYKYTEENGGSQDQQFREMCRVVDLANKNTDENTLFLFVCDGSYFSEERAGEDTRLDNLIAMTKTNKTVAIGSKNLSALFKFYNRMHVSALKT